jgi:hypothetical protein
VKANRISASLIAANRAKNLSIFIKLAQLEASLPHDPSRERQISVPGVRGKTIEIWRKQPGYQALVEVLRANRAK